ncbi:MAG: TraM recognition domain-containing protein [Proteobacteria bacterium]|nr:TraM recognition domain-containing protein [Pseudomonadota bacterium]
MENLDTLVINSSMMTRHCLCIGATGAGKSNFLNLLLKQQMMRAGGVLNIDGKFSKEALIQFLALAKQHNRWHDARIINISSDMYSNSYNPLLRGDADEIASRIMQLIPEAKGGDFFRASAGKGIRALTSCITKIGQPFNFRDLKTAMVSNRALDHLYHITPESNERLEMKNFLSEIKTTDSRTGMQMINDQKKGQAFNDLSAKLNDYTNKNMLNSYSPEVDLYDAIRDNLLIFVALPTLTKSESAINFAKLLLSDLRTVIGTLQNEQYKPSPTFLCLMDEFSSYASSSLDTVFEQARSTNICMFPLIQTMSSLSDQKRGLGEDFKQKIIGNAWNKFALKLKDSESCKEMSLLAGEKLKQQVSETFGEGLNFKGGTEDASMLRTSDRTRNYGKSISMVREAIVPPEAFEQLEIGEGIYIGDDGVYKTKTPYLDFEVKDTVIDMPKFKTPHKEGLSLSDKFSDNGIGT